MKNMVLFCTGLSGSGKSYFVDNILPAGAFYRLKSAATRPMRNGESEGNPYYFRDETYFDTAPLATRLFVNEEFWTPGTPKWLYGVPEFEIMDNLGRNFVYDVIQPKYARQMIDWFCRNKLTNAYRFKTLYFLSPENNFQIAAERANMPNDMAVRKNNTCNPIDFLRAGVHVDYFVKSSATETIIPRGLHQMLTSIANQKKR